LAIGKKAERLYKEWAKKYPDMAKAEKAANKTYYGVYLEFYKDETVSSYIKTKKCKNVPLNKYMFAYETPDMECYAKWFDTRAEAEQYLVESLRFAAEDEAEATA
jgi:hypothetical protein